MALLEYKEHRGAQPTLSFGLGSTEISEDASVMNQTSLIQVDYTFPAVVAFSCKNAACNICKLKTN